MPPHSKLTKRHPILIKTKATPSRAAFLIFINPKHPYERGVFQLK